MKKRKKETPASPEIEPEKADDKVKSYCFGERIRILTPDESGEKPEHRERGSVKGFRVSFADPDGSFKNNSSKEEK